MTSKYFFNTFIILCTLSLTFYSGCHKGPDVNPGHGKVTLDGKDLVGARINFTPKSQGEGEAAAGFTDENGVYKLKTFSTGHIGIVAGEYTVTFSKMEVEKTSGSVVNPETGEKTAATRSFETLPTIYTSIASSPFTVSVKKGEVNTFDFDLKSKP